MSHFCVLVIGDNVEKQLAPYQENNMGCCPEEYLKFVDEEKDCKDKYENEIVKKVVMPDGKLLREIKFKDLYSTFEEYMKNWCGFKNRDEKTGRYGYWENPNKKWDWWIIGGRWRGFFKMKPSLLLSSDGSLNEEIIRYKNRFGFSDGEFETLILMYKNNNEKFLKIVKKYGSIDKDIINSIKNVINKNEVNENISYRKGLLGEKSCFDETEEALFYGKADQALKKDIDFDSMIKEAEKEATKKYNMVYNLFNGDFKLEYRWKDLIDDNNENYNKLSIEEKRKIYHNQKILLFKQKLREKKNLTKEEDDFLTWENLEDFQCSKDEYIEKCKNKRITTFAVIKNEKWYEKGEMGWWGCVSDEKNQDEWNKEFNKLVYDLPDDVLLTIVDCHI